ncbi:FAD:protein FMN transferase [Candidatus Sumerlaeota bacterium]|nr:FAD:protein FMN transferase [Candidatus Sumerlaeota bacterium]
MGTIVDIQIPCPPGKREKAYEAIQEAQKEISRLEVLMSPYKAESDISRINAGAAREPTQVSRETFDTINKAIAFSRITNGAFDISFLPVGKLWRLDRDNPGIPAKEEIQDKLPLVNYENIRMHEGERKISFTREGMEIGLGGIAKGTAVDWAVKVIKKAGFSDALVNAGGDIYALGLNADRKPWRIGVLHPRDKSRFIARIDISNRAVVTSGDYERMIEVNGKRYHHILDPQTGYPSEKSMSVTVLAEDAETADALSTGLFVLGAEKGMKILKNIKGVDALFVTSEGDIFATPFFNIPQGKTLESIDHKSNKR